MQAGLLKEWIEIEREKENGERDQFGGNMAPWEVVFRKKAYIKFGSGTQRLQNMEETHTVINKVTIRYQPGINRDMRISYGGEKYKILSIDRDRIQQTLVIMCELINN